MTTIQTQNFGVEIEMTGITRETAATVIAKHYGTDSVKHAGGSYDKYTAKDTKGRTWQAMSDGSIKPEKRNGKTRTEASSSYKCEVVTPILQYEDIEDLQQIIRDLVKEGAIVNDSCGIHIHVDGANHTPASLVRLLNFAVGRQELFNEALHNEHRERWCKTTKLRLLKALKQYPNITREELQRVWYSSVNDDYAGGISTEHYNSTRYHGVNLHAFFTKGTVEFRLFNSTLHAGKIKAYIQFCLAMSAWAINAKNNLYFKGVGAYTAAQKEKLMKGMLKRRLGMSGPEFKTARLHLTAVFREKAAAEAAQIAATENTAISA
ncbi:MAG: amidoligase family protein [Ruminiclostridium sp.]|nr:amidoligase family protein [Ruminiclostridium sp.]